MVFVKVPLQSMLFNPKKGQNLRNFIITQNFKSAEEYVGFYFNGSNFTLALLLTSAEALIK